MFLLEPFLLRLCLTNDLWFHYVGFAFPPTPYNLRIFHPFRFFVLFCLSSLWQQRFAFYVLFSSASEFFLLTFPCSPVLVFQNYRGHPVRTEQISLIFECECFFFFFKCRCFFVIVFFTLFSPPLAKSQSRNSSKCRRLFLRHWLTVSDHTRCTGSKWW